MNRHLHHARYLWGLKDYDPRARVRYIADYLISETWDEAAYKRGWPDWAYAPQWGVLDRLGRLSCSVWGHDPTTDHCGMPAHDYCEVCNQRTPGAAQRPRLSEEENDGTAG